MGKTAGRGHKGQKARRAVSTKWASKGPDAAAPGVLPKRGFVSLTKGDTVE